MLEGINEGAQGLERKRRRGVQDMDASDIVGCVVYLPVVVFS